ncbi:uncharacterized protein LOC128718090 [Anopheles marshallii]|uniref:uncharacterized protein LOC128718090 n=1 Tax=Anopheles marshallii TaxID=1521116 RepID=UPI00237AFD55|nr:uncharacterized protein LOC128718090 [Anopheles marshallii]
MYTGVKTTNVGEVLPNDEQLGRRNCRWRELVQKYEDTAEPQSDHSMDIETAMVMLDQAMSDESSVSDVVEASSEEQSTEETPEEIKRQLKETIPLRKQGWEANGLKEILEDNEFRMLSHEKVENWLRNHMHSITGHYNVHYQTEQVTTVTETKMDADADSLYSVDTAQYIRSNKQISNKLKVTTMIKQYSVTSSVRRFSSLNLIQDKPNPNEDTTLPLPRALTKSDSACDVKKPLPLHNCSPRQTIAADKHHSRAVVPSCEPPTDRRNRRKVFKKTNPRKRPITSGDRPLGSSPTSAKQHRYDPEQVYAKALEQCARMKKTKPISQRKVSKRFANRMQNSLSSCFSESDSDEVFFVPARERPPISSRVKPIAQSTEQPMVVTPPEKNLTPSKTSPTEREIVEPFESITLSVSKRQRAQPAGPVTAAPCLSEPAKKRVSIKWDGCYHEHGLIIYRPKMIHPDVPTTDRIDLRMEDLTLTSVTKQRHLDKFREFNCRIHPNSTVCFYPSDSSDTAEEKNNASAKDGTATDNSYDDDDPILTFRPHKTKRLNVVEIPHRRPIT